MAEENLPKNDTVGLFLRAMVDREPGKRKVKPSKSALIDLAELDLGESSDDSDFNVDEAKLKEDDDISINSDPDDDDDEEEENEDDDSTDHEARNNSTSAKVQSSSKANITIGELLARAEEKQVLAAEQGISRPKILVCAICLGEYSDDANEIVTCDGCHVSVHEGCYGISDTISVSSTVSSSSTEPWFCDACKAGVSNPPCELCPNLGYTIFKETEMGRWVHLVCALYVPGIAFSEVDKLSFPTLFEMPYSRYGAKTCSLCEDERFCKTGVCIGCDAGMCRSYFHVTCAQKEGLLSEVNHGEADQADPYYAHCKLHTDRELMRRRKRNWLALQLHMKQGQKEKLNESQETQDRLQRKLVKYREKYMFTKANRPTPWFPTQKMPRPLSTSASFFRSLLNKTNLMGIDTESPAQEMQSIGDIRKKWHISPAFNVEFISYYLDRTTRLQEMKSKLDNLLKENEDLMKEEISLRNKYSKLKKDSQNLEGESTELLNKALEMHDLLKGLAGRPLRLPPVVAALHNPPYVDVDASAVSGLGIVAGNERRLITKAAAKMMSGSLSALSGCDNASFKSSSSKGVSTCSNAGQSSGGAIGSGVIDSSIMDIHTCSVCQLTKDQHLLIQCDTCSNYYHLSCLDPPLSRMPKKTKQMGWQCSDCCKSSDSDKAPEIDTSAPRRLRRIIKEPAKFSPSVAKDHQKSEQERLMEVEPRGDSSQNNQSAKSKVQAKAGTVKGGVKRRMSSDSKRGKKKKIRRSSLDSSRKGTSASNTKVYESSCLSGLNSPSSSSSSSSSSATLAPASSLLTNKSNITDNRNNNNSNNNNNDVVNNNDNNVPSSLDVSADSLPSPHSESFPSEEDPSGGTSSRRERRHREGGKKKKKDRDKEDGGRKRKKHHREKHPLAEMASEIVSPFRIKIKPLPPRPNGSESYIMPLPAPPIVASHTTTSTTTAPPGYPPLPPGYKLTQPMMATPKVLPQESANGPTLTGNVSQPNLSAASNNNSSSGSTSNNCNNLMGTSASTSASSSGTRPHVGRRKSDPNADQQFSKCDVCGETGGVTNTVMCDECLKAYHFNCLEPPLKRSPKRRGYSWFCEDCDNAAANNHDK